MKKVAIVVGDFPVPSETFIINEIRALKQAGHQIVVICFNLLDEQVAQRLDIEVCQVKDATRLQTFAAIAKSVTNLAAVHQYLAVQPQALRKSLLWYGAKIATLCHQYQVQHIHCHFLHHALSHGLVAKYLLGIKLSAIGHGHDVYQDQNYLANILPHCDLPIAVCKQMQTDLQQATKVEARLLPCGIHLADFPLQPLNLTTNNKLLFLGRVVEKKGLCYLLDALAAMPAGTRPHLDIVGDGQLIEAIRSQVELLKLEDTVQFLGFKVHKWLVENIQQYDALIAPFCIADNGDRDTGPLVLKEAMALGKPVITTNIMGCPDIVGQEAGFLVPAKNSQALVQVLAEFYQMTDAQRLSMALAARKRVEDKFDSLLLAKQLSGWIELECV